MPGEARGIDDGGGFYREPVLYDVINTPGTAREVDALEQLAHRYAPPAPWRWLEPGCGTGRYLRVLRGRKHAVAGYDALPSMLAYARARLARWPDGWTLAAGTFTGATPDLPPAEVAFCPVNSLRHLRDDEAVIAHLGQVARLLAPGGVYVVGLDMLALDAVPDEDAWTGARGRLQVQQVVQYLPPEGGSRRERVIVQMVVRRPGGESHHGWSYDLRTYTDAQWNDLVAAAGWRRIATADDGGRPVAPDGPPSYQYEVLQPDR
jgi:SAM-dependent methyltransferase